MHTILDDARSARGPRQEALTRAGVALLYAHWEGYTKNALSLYVKFVSRRRLKLNELTPGFAGMAADSEVRRRQKLSNQRHRTALVQLLMDDSDSRLSIPSKEVNTQGNLNSDLCRELLETFGLDFEPFVTKTALIDYNLLRARNDIAHGRWASVRIDDYESLNSQVLTLIETVRNLVLTAVDNGGYRRAG
ncbi:MAE_28990/MAE_18760 family HEPN-like nuclease [Protaetiibacter intestinalis]|nr:MAE_28990/MAE_18760 family HEPN-like nuclease [Protaetiibacter intestinalis]